MVKIDQNSCIGCGLCVKDCFSRNVILEGGKATTVHSRCIECGHCVAVCPQNAVSIENLDRSDVEEVRAVPVSPEDLLNFIKGRRSIRHFKRQAVEREKILKIVESGRFTATASNAQGLRYVIIEKEMETFRKLTIESLGKIGEAMLTAEDTTALMKSYASRWIRAQEAYAENPNQMDSLFFRAPNVILISGNSAIDAGLAASNMELMAVAEGLGVLYSGFITRACGNPKMREFLHVEEGKEVLLAVVVGYPDIQYQRSAPRKKAEILWK